MSKRVEYDFAMEKKMMNDLPKHQSGEVLYDELTQLPNRKYVTKYLKDVLEKASEDLKVALCIIDIDHFQRYIHFHGHSEGSHCLMHVADCMKTVIGNYKGILGHLGGDKYVCFLTDINPEKFAQFAETLRLVIENQSLLFCWEQHSFQVTISVGGVHGLVSQFEDKVEMLAIADDELYKAKSTGRNNVKIKFK